MPFCGFNADMLEGIDGFHKGLVEHGIIDRSKKKKQSEEKTMTKELEDMDAFLKETYLIDEPELRELTESLARYACAYYKYVQKKGVRNYREIIQFLNHYYFSMDDKYYSELEGKPEAMKKLAIYLNEVGSLGDESK
jgi:hypothetical protein